jgi:hypothetical protein
LDGKIVRFSPPSTVRRHGVLLGRSVFAHKASSRLTRKEPYPGMSKKRRAKSLLGVSARRRRIRSSGTTLRSLDEWSMPLS